MWIVILGGSWILLLVIALLLPGYIEEKIQEKINEQNIKVSSVEVNLISGSVEIKKLEWEIFEDTLKSPFHSFKINTLNIQGINLYELLVNNKILIKEIVLDSGKIKYNTKLTRNKLEIFPKKYSELKCTSIALNHIETKIMTDTVEALSTLLHLNITDASVKVDSTNTIHYSIKQSDGFAESINFSRNEGMYGSTIKKISFNTALEEITIDSILLIPNFSKFKFARYLGEQTSRLNISFPKLIIEGVAFKNLLDSVLIIRKIRIPSFDLYSFKDKRLPFLNTENVPLPMESFLGLPWKVKIDSILIANSRITIEEYPEKGDELTLVTFTGVNALFTGLNNRISKDDLPTALLQANGNLMGSARINAVFQFPLDGSPTYTAKGEILKFSLTELNPVFVPIANIRIESGFLNSLSFDFAYTDLRSKGTLDIDYENLRLLVLNKGDMQTHKLKTLLINLVLKKNRDQSGLNAKAVGVIDIERDRNRYIFNVWWKSVLDGLLSCMAWGSK